MTYQGMLRTMDFLYSERVAGLPPSALAEIFDRMIWCLADQGATLLKVRESWLLSDEKERVEIALAMDETYPFNERAKMAAVFAQISDKWPDLAPRCEELLNARKAEDAEA